MCTWEALQYQRCLQAPTDDHSSWSILHWIGFEFAFVLQAHIPLGCCSLQ